MSKNTSYHVPLSMRTGTIPYSLMNDYLFKLLMQENQAILQAFLCALLHFKPEEIISIEIRNSLVLGEVITDKQISLDINLLLNNNRAVNIEMQVANQGNWEDRSLIYLCRNFDNLSRGDDYLTAIPTHHIGILDFSLADREPEFYSHYYLMNEKTGKIYNDKFCLSVLDLNQIELATEEDIASGLQYWARFFKATTWEELKALAQQDAIFEAASDTIYDCMQNKAVYLSYLRRQEELAYQNHLAKKVDDLETQLSNTITAITEKDNTISTLNEEIKRLKSQLAAQTL